MTRSYLPENIYINLLCVSHSKVVARLYNHPPAVWSVFKACCLEIGPEDTACRPAENCQVIFRPFS
jgi:hypothetical protein